MWAITLFLAGSICRHTVAVYPCPARVPDGASIPALLRQLTHGSPIERRRAALALGSRNAPAKQIVPSLIRSLQDPDDEVRDASIAVLVQYQHVAMPMLVKALRDGNALTRRGIICVFRHAMSDVGKVKRPLLHALTDPDATVRKEVILYMTTVRKPLFVRYLINSIKDADSEVRWCAVAALSNYGEMAAEAIPSLLVVADKGGEMGDLAESALMHIGRPAVPLLKNMLDKGKRREQVLALSILSGMGMNAKPAAPIIARFLTDRSSRIRRCAALTLGSFGPKADVFLPELIKLLDDPMPRVRLAAIRAVFQVDPANRRIVPAMAKVLRDKDASIRFLATIVIIDFGPRGQVFVPRLIEMLDEPSTAIRQGVINTLTAIGPGAKQAIAKLKTLTHDKDYVIRSTAQAALDAIEKKE